MTRRASRPTGSHQEVILGLCSFTHDSAAALIVDGELVGFCEEERLSGVKHTAAYPREIDCVVAGRQRPER